MSAQPEFPFEPLEFPDWLVRGFDQVEHDLDEATRIRGTDADKAEELTYRALSRACELLTRAFGLGPFVHVPDRVAYTKQMADTVTAIVSDRARYDEILDVERRLLINVGFAERQAFRIVDECRRSFEALAGRPGPGPDEADEAFRYLAKSTCETAGSYDAAIEERRRREEAERNTRFAGLAFKGLCGVVLTLLDYSTLVVVIPIPGVSAVSDRVASSVAAELPMPALA